MQMEAKRGAFSNSGSGVTELILRVEILNLNKDEFLPKYMDVDQF